MSQAALTHAHDAHGTHNRLLINRLGLWLFIVSESFLFGALLWARFYLQGLHRPHELNQFLGLIITCILLGSSLTAYRAEVFAAHGEQQKFLQHVMITIVLGIVFLVGVGYEWYEAAQHFPPDTGFGTVFFSLTGMHAFHVLSGVVLLMLLNRLAQTRHFHHGDYWPAEAIIKYWHYVDVVWVFVYPTLYLVG